MILIKKFMTIIMVFSVFSLSQRYISGNFNLKMMNESSEAGEHFHDHSFMNELKFLVLGFLIHTHEHGHDDADGDSHETHGSTHSHAEISRLKTDFITGQNFLFFSKDIESVFGTSVLNLHYYDHPFQIFLPPILS